MSLQEVPGLCRKSSVTFSLDGPEALSPVPGATKTQVHEDLAMTSRWTLPSGFYFLLWVSASTHSDFFDSFGFVFYLPPRICIFFADHSLHLNIFFKLLYPELSNEFPMRGFRNTALNLPCMTMWKSAPLKVHFSSSPASCRWIVSLPGDMGMS